MKTCPSCGGSIRDEAEFCPLCGRSLSGSDSGAQRASSDVPATTVPLITFAPKENTLSQQRIKSYGKIAGIVLLVILLALGAAAAAAWLQTDPFMQSSSAEIDNDTYNKCLQLVKDVRNDNFDNIVEDLVNMSGDAENYNFLTEYEKLFKGLIPDEGSTDSQILFRNACFMVSYTEFQAKRFENLAAKPLVGQFYTKKANMFRNWADELWSMLTDADSDADYQKIVAYCDENDIIHLQAPDPTEPETEAVEPAAGDAGEDAA